MTTTAPFPSETRPGIYDVPAAEYHQHPALSTSGAKLLLDCPARYRWEREHPTAPTDAMEMGTAAHTAVLGTGHPIVLVPYDDLRTKDAKAFVKDAREAGQVPLKADAYERVQGMVKALKDNPVAAALLDPDAGRAEVSLLWDDTAGRPFQHRARLDWLPDPSNGRLIVPDYKKATSARPDAFARTCYGYGYDMQAAHYLEGAEALQLGERPAFVFIVQEPTPPYLVSVVWPDADMVRIGAIRMREAADTLARCLTTGDWPGYTPEPEPISLPGYIIRDYEGLAA